MIMQRRIDLEAADILALNSTPFEVPFYADPSTPPADIGCIVGAFFDYRFGTTPYTMTGNINLYYEDDMVNPLLGNGAQTIDLGLSQDICGFVPGWIQYAAPPVISHTPHIPITAIKQEVLLFADGADPTDGDGTMLVTVFWAELGIGGQV